MGYVPFPTGVSVRSLRWRAPFDTSQVNRSEFTGNRQVVELPGAGRWSVSGEFVTMIGQAQSYKPRSFLAALRGPKNFFALPAWEARQASQLPLLASRQPLANPINVSISGRDVTKTASNGNYDGQAVSNAGLTSGCILMFRAGGTGAFAAGINTDPFTNAVYTSLDYAFFCEAGEPIQIYEQANGFLGNFGYPVPGDLFTIIYTNAQVLYFINGALVRAVSASAGQTFYFDCSLRDIGTTISDIGFAPRNNVSAGATSALLFGFSASLPRQILGGWLATALFEDGSSQPLMVIQDAPSDSLGRATALFDAPLRRAAYAIVLDYPFAHMALADAAEWGVDPGQIYSAGFTAEEAW